MKVAPPVGWLIGLAVGTAAFFTVGIGILFSISYSVIHGSSSNALITVILFSAWIAVIGACLWLAYRVKVAVSRDH